MCVVSIGDGGWSDATYEVLIDGKPSIYRVDYGACDGSASILCGKKTVDFCENGDMTSIEAAIKRIMASTNGA